MSLDRLGVVGIAIYLVLLVGVAEVARRARRDRSPADHVLAARGLGAFVLFLTLYATAYSGNSLLGYPGEAYRRGYSWIMSTGFMLAIIVAFHALAPGLRAAAVARGFVTPGDWIRERFGTRGAARWLGYAVAVLMAVALSNFLLAQLTAMGVVASEVTGGRIPYQVGVVGLAAVILFYETLGGMRAVAWTDAAQGILMLVGLGWLLAWLLGEPGGLAGVTREVARLRPDAVAVPRAAECANWLSSILLLGLASVVYPQAIQRIYAASSSDSLRRALAMMSFMPLATTTVVCLIGIAAIPQLESLGRLEADAVMPRLLGVWAGEGAGATVVAMLVFMGALAAIMSTADSVLLSLGSLVAGDLMLRAPTEPETTRTGKRIAAGVMVVMVAVALEPRFTLWRLIELKMELLIQCVPAFVVALHWRRLGPGPILAGLLVGTAIAAGGTLLGVKRLGGIHLGVIGLAVNLAVCAMGAWRFPRREAIG